MYTQILFELSLFLFLRIIVSGNLLTNFRANTITPYYRNVNLSSTVAINFKCDNVVLATESVTPTNNVHIKISELENVLRSCEEFLHLDQIALNSQRWRVIIHTDDFILYKRRASLTDNGPYEYLIIGAFSDVSPRNFLLCQTQDKLRRLWDQSVREMNVIDNSKSSVVHMGGFDKNVVASDVIYYRTKWPWPLQDRDYTLERRSSMFPLQRALVFMSRAIEDSRSPPVRGALRVRNYRCQSAFFPAGPPPHVTTPPPLVTSLHQVGVAAARKEVLAAHLESNPLNKMRAEFASKADSAGLAITTAFHQATAGYGAVGSEGECSNGCAALPLGGDGCHPSSEENWLDQPGVRFVSLFCDDQQVPLPSAVIDALSSYGERMAMSSVLRLRSVAREQAAE